jgi:hypothetical protein
MPDIDIQRGARNLLLNCADMVAGQKLLILVEDSTTGYYDPALAIAVTEAAEALGISVTHRSVPFLPDATEPSGALAKAMLAADRTLFLSRIGDQLRFSSNLAQVNPVVSYALDAGMLGSGFGWAHHHAFRALKDRLNEAFARASEIHVTCPLGTDFRGPGAVFPQSNAEVTVRRFPLSVSTPVPAEGFHGQIAQAGFLTGTGSNYYQPYSVALNDVLMVRFTGNRITGFDGTPADVQTAQDHYDRVARRFGIDGSYVHSWHAGMHPGCAFHPSAAANFERWGGAAFGNPRILHFHTCGAYAPGEISINVVDPTIRLDGVAVWQDGRLYPERIAGGAEILQTYPCAAKVFADPSDKIGLGPDGRLSAQA